MTSIPTFIWKVEGNFVENWRSLRTSAFQTGCGHLLTERRPHSVLQWADWRKFKLSRIIPSVTDRLPGVRNRRG